MHGNAASVSAPTQLGPNAFLRRINFMANNLSPSEIAAGWQKAIELNNEHIRRKQQLADAGLINSDLSGIKVLQAENEMYELLIDDLKQRFDF